MSVEESTQFLMGINEDVKVIYEELPEEQQKEMNQTAEEFAAIGLGVAEKLPEPEATQQLKKFSDALRESKGAGAIALSASGTLKVPEGEAGAVVAEVVNAMASAAREIVEKVAELDRQDKGHDAASKVSVKDLSKFFTTKLAATKTKPQPSRRALRTPGKVDTSFLAAPKAETVPPRGSSSVTRGKGLQKWRQTVKASSEAGPQKIVIPTVVNLDELKASLSESVQPSGRAPSPATRRRLDASRTAFLGKGSDAAAAAAAAPREEVVPAVTLAERVASLRESVRPSERVVSAAAPQKEVVGTLTERVASLNKAVVEQSVIKIDEKKQELIRRLDAAKAARKEAEMAAVERHRQDMIAEAQARKENISALDAMELDPAVREFAGEMRQQTLREELLSGKATKDYLERCFMEHQEYEESELRNRKRMESLRIQIADNTGTSTDNVTLNRLNLDDMEALSKLKVYQQKLVMQNGLAYFRIMMNRK